MQGKEIIFLFLIIVPGQLFLDGRTLAEIFFLHCCVILNYYMYVEKQTVIILSMTNQKLVRIPLNQTLFKNYKQLNCYPINPIGL